MTEKEVTATEEELRDEKKRFLEDLEESDVEKEETEKEESSSEDSEDEFDPNDSDNDKKGFMAKKAPPKRKVAGGRGGGVSKIPTALTSEMSAYEKIREGNICS